jgi:hypothetical protein
LRLLLGRVDGRFLLIIVLNGHFVVLWLSDPAH